MRATGDLSNYSPNTLTENELEAYKGVWVYVEHERDKIMPASLEMLGAGRKLADTLHEELVAIVIGYKVEDFATEIAAYGADKVVIVEHELLKSFNTDGYTTVLSDLIQARRPSIILFAATLDGRDLASRVAARVRAGLAADCTALEINEKKQLVQIRPDFGGKSLSAILTPRTRPEMTTVRPGAIRKPKPEYGRKALLEKLEGDLKPEYLRVKVLRTIEEERSPSDEIESASKIVAAGLGIRAPENLKMIGELADALGAVVAGSLAIVKRDWIPSSRLVGQTGKTVAPELYIAIGISGAIQHTVGMDQSKVIIAINEDSSAPIFKYANYGMVGNLFEVVPLLTEELRKISKKDLQEEKSLAPSLES